MHFSLSKIALGSALCSLSSLTTASPFVEPMAFLSHRTVSPTDSIHLSYLFTANITLGTPSKPINIAGGVLEDEPILNGTVSGPAINATIKGGLAYPQILESGAVQVVQIVLYGSADDGTPFTVEELGIGSEEEQVTRIQFSVGGGTKYKALRDGYVLAGVHRISTTSVLVQGYLVTASNATS